MNKLCGVSAIYHVSSTWVCKHSVGYPDTCGSCAEGENAKVLLDGSEAQGWSGDTRLGSRVHSGESFKPEPL